MNTSKQEYSACLTSPTVTAAEFRAFRENLGLTQKELARHYGIPLQTIQQWERSNVILGFAAVFST